MIEVKPVCGAWLTVNGRGIYAPSLPPGQFASSFNTGNFVETYQMLFNTTLPRLHHIRKDFQDMYTIRR